MKENEPKISVIVPSFDGFRGGNVEKLKEQLNAQTIKPHEIIVVIGVSPNGKARNEGVKKASGDFYVFIDDDVTLGHDRVLKNLVKPFLEKTNVGMTGPSQLIPEDSNRFQRVASKQIPRSLFPVQTKLVDSDMVTHMCLCMPAELFKKVGWENPDIIAGTDPDLRYRVRKAGYRVCVVPDTWAYHPMPETFWKLMKLSYIKGKNSAIVRKTYPELIFELDTGFKKEFEPKKNTVFRILRNTGIILYCILTFKIIRFSVTLIYGLGNLLESLKK